MLAIAPRQLTEDLARFRILPQSVQHSDPGRRIADGKRKQSVRFLEHLVGRRELAVQRERGAENRSPAGLAATDLLQRLDVLPERGDGLRGIASDVQMVEPLDGVTLP